MATTSATGHAEAAAAATEWVELTPRTPRTPDVSIIFPTYDRPDLARRLIEVLGRQSLAPGRFEILGVDDGSPEPVIDRVRGLAPACHVALGRKDNGGPAQARNAAIARARGRYLLILNDDAVPAPDLAERHLEAQAREEAAVATLGTFDYSERARRSRWVRFLERSGLTFGYTGLSAERLADFWSFWTCNICVEKELVDSVGGFDEDLPDPLTEDIELGWRLQRDRGVRVRYVPEARCVHDHLLEVDDYVRRQRMLGTNCYRLYKKYDNVSMLSLGLRGGQASFSWLGPFDRGFFLSMQKAARRFERPGRQAWELLRRWEQLQLRVSDELADRHDLPDETLLRLEGSLTRWAFVEAVAEAGLADPDL